MTPKTLNCYTIAVQAYIYGFAAVEMERTRRILTNTAVTTGGQVPMNQILHNKRLVTAADREVVTPNNDTPYSIMFLDLSKEPMLLHIPAYGDRYFTFPFMDAYTEQFCAIGQRKQGPPGQQVIAAPNGGDLLLLGRVGQVTCLQMWYGLTRPQTSCGLFIVLWWMVRQTCQP